MRSDAEMLGIVQARARAIRRHRLLGAAAIGSAAMVILVLGAVALLPAQGRGREVRTSEEPTTSTTTSEPSTTTSDTTEASSTTTSTTSTTSPQTSTVPPTSVTPSTIPVDPPISTTTTTPVTLCSSDQVDAYVFPHQTVYAPGHYVQFDAHAHNVSDQNCPETGWAFEIKITDSGGNVVSWIQVANGGPDPYQLKPGDDEWEMFIWYQTDCPLPSADDCGGPQVPPGVYTIHSDIGGYVSSAQVTIG